MVIRAARVLASVVMRATARQSAAVRRNFSARSGMCALYAAQTPQDRIGSALCKPRARLSSCPEQLYELIGHKAGFEQLQSGLRNVHFGLTVEVSAISPVDPRPPQPGQRAAKPAAWSRVLQASNDASRLHHPAQLSHASNLQLVGKRAEQEGSHRRVERAVGKVKA